MSELYSTIEGSVEDMLTENKEIDEIYDIASRHLDAFKSFKDEGKHDRALHEYEMVLECIERYEFVSAIGKQEVKTDGR